MSDEFTRLVEKYSLSEKEIIQITDVTERNARAWLAGEKHVPESVVRLIKIVMGEEQSDKYRP